MLSLPPSWRCGYSKMHLYGPRMITTQSYCIMISKWWSYDYLCANGVKQIPLIQTFITLILVCAFGCALWSVNSFYPWIIKDLSLFPYLIWNAFICCHALLTFLQTLAANARPELPTHEFLQLLHRLNIYNEPLCYFADMCLLGLPLHSKCFLPFPQK